ncbi:MAG: glycosyltransferase, partial [Actinomycetota bacterium]
HGSFRRGDATSARRSLGLGDETVLLSVGRVQPLKGLDLAIRACAELRDRSGRAPLLVVVGGASGGSGRDHLRRLEALIAALGLDDRVRFVGPQPHSSLPEYYRAADALLMCSYSESFGLAALEAHACGVPVVATDVGGLRHIVRDGTSGFLVDGRDPAAFAERLGVLLERPELWKTFSSAAQRSAASFEWDAAATSMLELYDCLVEERVPQLCTC